MSEKDMIIEKAYLLKAISNPIRLCLIKKLIENGKLNITYFTNCMDVSQSSISQNLAKLRDLKVVDFERDGKNVNYFIINNEVKNIVDLLFRRGNE